MHAMVLEAPGAPLRFQQRNDPTPGSGAVRVKVSACGVCCTDLHVVDTELPGINYPIVPGYEVVGRVEALAPGATIVKTGERVGVPWLGYTCGECLYCRSGRENLCDHPPFTGYTRDVGFARHLVADARYCCPLGEAGDDVVVALLLCAGLIGWRSHVMAGGGKHLGIYGFGGRRTHHRPGGALAEPLRLRAHARWRRRDAAPSAIAQCGLDRGIGRTAAGAAGRCHHLRSGRHGGAAGVARCAKGRSRGLCRHSHVGYSVLPLQYPVLRRQLLSVANLTRSDGVEPVKVAARAGVKTHTAVFALREANGVLSKVRSGQISGAAVLQP